MNAPRILPDLSQTPPAQAARAVADNGVSFKITAKKPDGTGSDGAISVYGLGRFPTTLYAGQWEKLAAALPDLLAFIAANADRVSRKS